MMRVDGHGQQRINVQESASFHARCFFFYDEEYVIINQIIIKQDG
jgi:hypothetical protein